MVRPIGGGCYLVEFNGPNDPKPSVKQALCSATRAGEQIYCSEQTYRFLQIGGVRYVLRLQLAQITTFLLAKCPPLTKARRPRRVAPSVP